MLETSRLKYTETVPMRLSPKDSLRKSDQQKYGEGLDGDPNEVMRRR
jgi:hypothetical protein